MVLFLALGTLAVAMLLMPEVFGALGEATVENPGWGLGILALLVLLGSWIYKR